MSQDEHKRIGLIVGREWDWPSAFMTAVNERDESITAELVMLGGTFMNQGCSYTVIVDRTSHDIPYYRAYLKHAAIGGTYIINNPFVWSADSKFFGMALINKLGLISPRTVVLPNKHLRIDVVPESFRNLIYPMDWQAIIDYVGVPAIFKDTHTGGRRAVHRVHNVDELIQRYDESGIRTMILQELIESDTHIHCFVVGQEKVLPLYYSLGEDRYLPAAISTRNKPGKSLVKAALALTRVYGYDVNMVECVVKNDQLYIINSTNPAPEMNKTMMTADQFEWCITEMADLAISRAKRPIPQRTLFNFDDEML